MKRAGTLLLLLAVSAGAVELPAPLKFERASAPPPAATAAAAPLGSQSLDELANVLADRAYPELLADLARYRPGCLSWRPAALRLDCPGARVRRDVPAQALFLATRFLVVMYGSRGYLVYAPAMPATIGSGEDIRRAAISAAGFLRAARAAQLLQAQRRLDQSRRR